MDDKLSTVIFSFFVIIFCAWCTGVFIHSGSLMALGTMFLMGMFVPVFLSNIRDTLDK